MPAITKEYLDSLPEETIFFIRDYVWNRFGNRPNTAKSSAGRESSDDPEAASRRRR